MGLKLKYSVFKNMGRTITSYRYALEKEIGSWKLYREGLKPAYRQHFDNIMLYAKMHSDAGSLSARMFISESLFLSALIEQQKSLDILERDFKRIKRRAKI